MDDELKNKNSGDEMEFIPDEESASVDFHKKIKKVKDDLTHCEAEKKQYLEGWQRAKADFINYKNDEGKRMEDMARFITSGLIQEVLPVLDSFDLAVGHGLQPEVERGVLLIRSQFEDILKRRGLERFMVQEGDNFSPEKHESIGEVISDKPEGSVAEVVQQGYGFRGRVLRPARVRLSKAK